ncbi:hypothetical protein NS96R_04285 [Pseudomonas parafulva]|uniref:Uncharacterized protein n=1 Tax=Pseudomonas parafulva TaxID=157782 RepID=A0AAJ0LP71_9PSED|nr:hypothetical protein NS96R_04285 [Pseudomonas parafulva]
MFRRARLEELGFTRGDFVTIRTDKAFNRTKKFIINKLAGKSKVINVASKDKAMCYGKAINVFKESIVSIERHQWA